MQSKQIKILAHKVIDAELSVWIDSRIRLQKLADLATLMRTDLGLIRHPRRSCIYQEAEHCQRIGRGDPEKISEAVARYRQAGHPDRFGLWMGGLVVRRHTPTVNGFNEAWWHEVLSGTPRDQIVLPVVLRRLGMPFDTLPDDWVRFQVRRRSG